MYRTKRFIVAMSMAAALVGLAACSHDRDDHRDRRREPARASDNFRDRDHDGVRDGLEDRDRDGVKDGNENGGRNRRDPDVYR